MPSPAARHRHPHRRRAAADIHGGVYFGGRVAASSPQIEDEYVGGGDAVVGKLSENGDVEWVRSWGSSNSETTVLTLATPDGGVVAAGISGGQAPGKPASVAGGPWFARYEDDGTRTFLEQYEPLSGIRGLAPGAAFVDSHDRVVLVYGNHLQKLTLTDGSEAARISTPSNVVYDTPFYGYLPVVPRPDSNELYVWRPPTQYGSNSPQRSVLCVHSLDGMPLAFQEVEPPRNVVIDDVEDVIWTGDMSGGSLIAGTTYHHSLALSSSAVFLTGVYRNSYENGSVTRPTTTRFWVGRYDLATGDRMWFQQFDFDEMNAPEGHLMSNLMDISLDTDGALRILMSDVYKNMIGQADGILFKLDATNGSLL